MKLIIMKSDFHNPYYNLAIEECAFNKMKQLLDSVLLYTWVNEPSVIIGRNQNPFAECDLKKMEHDGINLVRRKTGGGAVFHDLGNLNYTLIGSGDFVDREQWNSAICNAVNSYGLICKKSGRNDFLVNGFKVSGSAFMHEDNTYLQHGTMMVNVRLDAIKRYLTPQKSKLQRHGIKSVEQRVRNLHEINSAITINGIEENIHKTISELYGEQNVQYESVETFLNDDINDLFEKYVSRDFVYGEFTSYEQYSDDSL